MDSRIPHRVEHLIAEDIDGELLLVNSNINELISLSESGRTIWEFIDGRNSVEEIVARVCAACGTDAEALAEDDTPDEFESEVVQAAQGTVGQQIRSFLGILQEKQLITFELPA